MAWLRPIRVLVVGDFGTARAEPFALGPGELNGRLADARVRATVEVPDRLGDERARGFELSFPKLRAFTIDALVHGVPLLSELRALASHVSAKQILPGVERLVGRGRLYRALEAADEASEASAQGAPAGREPSLEDLMRAAASASADREKAAARALDIFVRAGRDKPAPPGPPAVKKPRAVHAVLEEAVRSTACDLLAHPTTARLEAAWRGLKLLSDQLPDDRSVALEVADVRADYELDVLQMREHDARLPRPDLVVLAAPSASLERLRACAEHAERLEAVCVVGVDAKALGAERLDALRGAPGAGARGLPAIGSDERARWLCLAANPVLLHSEPAVGDEARLTFVCAAWGVAAVVLAAQRKHGRVTRMLHPDTLLDAPTFWVPSRGADAGMALPTLEFCSVRAQTELAELGVAALGSTRRGDGVLMSRAPTAFCGEAAQALASQLVIGRIVRAAREARALIAERGPDAEARALAAQRVAEGVPAGLERAVRVDVALEPGEPGEARPQLAVRASADRFEALSPFAIAFSLEC